MVELLDTFGRTKVSKLTLRTYNLNITPHSPVPEISAHYFSLLL